MSIREEIITQVAAANDIVEIIGTDWPLIFDGKTYRALCPFHRADGFQVDRRRQVYRCYGCGAGGSVFRYVMDRQQLSFGEAVNKLAARAGIRVPQTHSGTSGDD